MEQQKEEADQLSQIQEDVDLALNVNQLKKILVDIIAEEHGIDNERAWKVSCAISIHYSKIALMHLKLNDLQNCELFLKKSKQFTEPAYGDQKWKQFEEWHFQRISISIHFAILYKKQKRFDVLCEVLKQQIKEVEMSTKCESIMKNIESKFETVYFQLSEICFHLKQFDETIIYCQKSIDCIEWFEAINKDENGDINLLKKKIIMKIHSFYIIGLSYFTKEKWQESLKYYKKAYHLGQQILGENNPNVLKYKKNFEQIKQQIFFQDQINLSLNSAQIDNEIDQLKKQEKSESHIFSDKSVLSQSSNQQQKKNEQQQIQQAQQKQLQLQQQELQQSKQIQSNKSQISQRPFSAVTQQQQQALNQQKQKTIIKKKDFKINQNAQLFQSKQQQKNVQSANEFVPIRKFNIQKTLISMQEHKKRIHKANNFRLDISDQNLKLSNLKEQQIQSQKFPIATKNPYFFNINENNRPISSISKKIELPQLDINPIDSSQFLYPNTGFYSTNFAQTPQMIGNKNQLPIFSAQNYKKTFGQELQKLLDDESFQQQSNQRIEIERNSLNNLLMQRPSKDKSQQNLFLIKEKSQKLINKDQGYVINLRKSSQVYAEGEIKIYQEQNIQRDNMVTQQSAIPSIDVRQSSMHSSQFNDLEMGHGYFNDEPSAHNILQTHKLNMSRRASSQLPNRLDLNLSQNASRRYSQQSQIKPATFLDPSPYSHVQSRKSSKSDISRSSRRKSSNFLNNSNVSQVKKRHSSKISENQIYIHSNIKNSYRKSEHNLKTLSNKQSSFSSAKNLDDKKILKENLIKDSDAADQKVSQNASESQLSVESGPEPLIILKNEQLKLKFVRKSQYKFRKSLYGIKGMVIKYVCEYAKDLIEKIDPIHMDQLHPLLLKQKNIQQAMNNLSFRKAANNQQDIHRTHSSQRKTNQNADDQDDQLQHQIKNLQKYKITKIMEVCNLQEDSKFFMFYSTRFKDAWDIYTFTDVKFQFYFYKINQLDFRRDLRVNFNMQSKFNQGIFTIILSGVHDSVIDFKKKDMLILDKWQLADYLLTEYLDIQDYSQDYNKMKKQSKNSFQLIAQSKNKEKGHIHDREYQYDLFMKINFLIQHHAKLSESLTTNQQFIIVQDIYNDEDYINLLNEQDQLNNKYLNYEENMKERTQVSKERSKIKRNLQTKITVMQPQVLTKIGYQKWKKNPDYSKDYEVFYKQFNFLPNEEVFQKQKKQKNLPQNEQIKSPILGDEDQLQSPLSPEIQNVQKSQTYLSNLTNKQIPNKKNKQINFQLTQSQSQKQQNIPNLLESQDKLSKIANKQILNDYKPDLEKIDQQYEDDQIKRVDSNEFENEYLPRTPVPRPKGKVKNTLNIQYFEYNQSQIFKEVPEVLINPFYINQQIFKSLVRIKQKGLENSIYFTFLILQLRVQFGDKSLYICENPSDLNIKIKSSRLTVNLKQLPEYEINLQEFLKLTLKNNDFKFNQFLYDGKFNNKQKQIIAYKLNNLIKIEGDGFENKLQFQSDTLQYDMENSIPVPFILKEQPVVLHLQNILDNSDQIDEYEPFRSTIKDIQVIEQIIKQQLPQDLFKIIFDFILEQENYQVYTTQKYYILLEERKKLEEQLNQSILIESKLSQGGGINLNLTKNVVKVKKNLISVFGKTSNRKILINFDFSDQQKHYDQCCEKPIDHKNNDPDDLMEYYNSYQSISKLKYMFYRLNCFIDGFKKKIKIQFKMNSDSKLSSEIILFDPLGYKIDRITIMNDFDIEKLINLIQIISDPIKHRLMLMSLTQQKRLIGRKLIFKSYVEKNQELFNFQFNRKFNKNDNNLFRMLTISGYLQQNPINQNKFLYKIKLALISSDINSQLSEQNFFLSTYFHTRRVRQFSRIKNLGNALIQTVVYMTNLLYTDNECIFIRLDVSFVKSRTKQLKFIMDVTDIQELIMPEFSRKNCLENQTIYTMVKLLCQKLVYFDSSTYSGLKIPMSLISAESTNHRYDNMHRYDLLNSFSSDILLDYNKQAKQSMLTAVLRSIKVIYQAIKKIGQNYVVVSVRRVRMDYMDQFLILIYVPKVTRQFICFMSPLDFKLFEPAFMEKLFPYIFWQKNSILKEFEEPKEKIYLHFSNKYNQYVGDPDKIIKDKEKEDQQKRASISLRRQSITKKLQQTTPQNAKDSQKQQVIQRKGSLVNTAVQVVNQKQGINRSSTFKQLSYNEKEKSNVQKIKLEKIPEPEVQEDYTTNSQAFMRLFKESQLDATQFLELLIWEKLVNLMEIYLNNNQNFILKINSFHGILRELLHMEVLNLNPNNNCHFEAYIQKRSKVPSDPNLVDLNYMKNAESLFEPFTIIKIQEAFCYSMYIRIKFFERPSQSNDKLVLRHILYTYFRTEPGKLKNKNLEDNQMNLQINENNLNKMDPKRRSNQLKTQEDSEEENVLNCQHQDYQFIQADLQEMAIYCANKIRNSYLINKPEELFKEIGNLNTAQQRVLSMRKANLLYIDNKCPSLLKINFKTYKNQLDNIDKRYLLFFRCVFTIKPMQMITISYKPLNSKFYILIWNTNNSRKILKKLTLQEIQNTIPYILDMFKLQQYNKIGKRIYQSYKNKLMLNTFERLNPQNIDHSNLDISF